MPVANDKTYPAANPEEPGPGEARGHARNGDLTVEETTKALATGIADAIGTALLALFPRGGDARSGSSSAGFQKAAALSQTTGLDPLIARLDQAITTEIGLRSDLARFEYRAIVAEKEARRAEERFVQKEQDRTQEVHLLRQVIADLESQVERLSAHNGHLDNVVNDMRHQENELRGAVSNVAASRWVKVGTRLGLSQLHRHLDQRAPRDHT